MLMIKLKHKNKRFMSLQSKKEYLEVMRKEYLKATKKQKSKILDEYCKRTGENRKYAIKKFNYKIKLKQAQQRKKRPCKYKGDVVALLVELWDIFDNPCGQRLKPLIDEELDSLISFGEIKCSDFLADQVKSISSATIDRKLRHEKQVRKFKLKRAKTRKDNLLSLVPTKTSYEIDRKTPGIVQMDCVEHCGISVAGEYVNSLATVDIYSGRWEAEAVMGLGQKRALEGMKMCKKRHPVEKK